MSDLIDKEVGLLIAEWRSRRINHEQLMRGIDLALDTRGARMSAWSKEPPDTPTTWLLVWDTSRGCYRLLEPLGPWLWCRHDRPSKTYDVGKLLDCAARSDWKFQAIELPPPPPDDEWEDVT